MRKALLLATAIGIISSCGVKSDKKLIEDAFLKYVETDFGNPNDFVKITSLLLTDSTVNADRKSTLEGLDHAIGYFKDKMNSEDQKKTKHIQNEFSKIGTSYVYILKARVKEGRELCIKKFTCTQYSGTGEIIIIPGDYNDKEYSFLHKDPKLLDLNYYLNYLYDKY